VIGKRNLASQPPDRAGGVVPSDPNTVLSLRDEWLKEVGPVRPDYTTVVDGDRKFVEVSDSFCQLMGYRREELIGIRYDDLTALGTSDIPTVFRLFCEPWLYARPMDVSTSNRRDRYRALRGVGPQRLLYRKQDGTGDERGRAGDIVIDATIPTPG